MKDFGHAELIEPEAIGQPGKRAFRLRVMSGNAAASLWLEKEQLAALTLAIHQLLEQTPDEPAGETDAGASETFPTHADVDFKIGRLGIGYDEAERMVVLFAYTMEDAEDDDSHPEFACRVSRSQCRTFAQRAEETISAGRPVCVLCGVVIEDGSHQCLRRNGHSDHPIALDDDER